MTREGEWERNDERSARERKRTTIFVYIFLETRDRNKPERFFTRF